MTSKPKYIVILTGLFCSVVAGVLRTFTRFFFVNVLARIDNYGLTTWQAKPRPKTIRNIISSFNKFVSDLDIETRTHELSET